MLANTSAAHEREKCHSWRIFVFNHPLMSHVASIDSTVSMTRQPYDLITHGKLRRLAGHSESAVNANNLC